MQKLENRAKRIIDGAIDISNNPATIREAAYMHIVLCQLGLPRSSLKETFFTRASDGASISINIPADEKNDCSAPHGVIPRLILLYVCSQATLRKSKVIDICGSQTAFMQAIDLNPSGGKNGIRKNLKRQFIHLSKVSFELILFTNNKKIYFFGKIFETEPYDIESGKWNKEIKLSEEFYNSLITDKNSIPLDKRAIYALQRSTLALDLYFMLSERLHRVARDNYILRWKKLREQFGQEYANNKGGRINFKKAFAHALDQVRAVYPNAVVEIVKCGLKIGKSEPPIPKSI
jgi:hypothetical protein